MKWKGSCIKPSLYCSVKSNKFRMLRRTPTAKAPKLLSTDFSIFCWIFWWHPFPSQDQEEVNHWTMHFWASGRFQTQFCLLCFWSSFPIYILISLGHSLFKREEIWVVFFFKFCWLIFHCYNGTWLTSCFSQQF